MLKIAPLAAALAILWAGAAQAEHQYIGVKDCGRCHKKELMGDQLSSWQKGPHAKAMESLKSEKALSIAKERGLAQPPHETDECVRCHATASGLSAEQLYKKKPLKISDSVQCESCHGPGSDYRKNKIMSDRDAAIAKGMWEPGKNEKVCLACHNADSPTIDASKPFDFEASKEKIAHSIPEDVKGHYLEKAKERRKAAKGGSGAEDAEDDD